MDDPLQPTRCPRCLYALTGLPPAGVCPECGRAYSPDEVVLLGHADALRSGYPWGFSQLVLRTNLLLFASFIGRGVAEGLGWPRTLGWLYPSLFIAPFLVIGLIRAATAARTCSSA